MPGGKNLDSPGPTVTDDDPAADRTDRVSPMAGGEMVFDSGAPPLSAWFDADRSVRDDRALSSGGLSTAVHTLPSREPDGDPTPLPATLEAADKAANTSGVNTSSPSFLAFSMAAAAAAIPGDGMVIARMSSHCARANKYQEHNTIC